MNSSFRLVFSRPRVAGVASLFLLAGLCSANTMFSEMGTLSTPEDTVLINLTLTTTGNVTLQTYGFGGGTNAAATLVPSGGFDAFVGLFSGTGPTALFINGTSDILSNYSPGCPPAGTLTIGSVPAQCGDVNLQFTSLPAGTYTVLLTDGANVPNAVFESSPAYLGDGFTDLTGGVFQTCYDANDCNNDTGHWALDITAPDGSTIPEPAPLGMVVMGLAFAAGLGRAQFGKTLKPRSQR
jgi:hypothetical protein